MITIDLMAVFIILTITIFCTPRDDNTPFSDKLQLTKLLTIKNKKNVMYTTNAG